MPSALRLSNVLPALASLGFAAGCAQLDWKQPVAWVSRAEDEPQTPARMVVVWTDAVAQHPDRRPTRGFGGRLMFYGPEDDAPIRVDGALVVYGYDEEGRDPKDTQADRKYVFTREQFATHYGKSKLGDSYSIWVPWDEEVGGPRRQVALICRFQPVDGPAVVSEQTVSALPGASTPIAMKVGEQADRADSVGFQATGVRPVAHHAPIPQDHAEGQTETVDEPRIKTTTIPIPPHFGRRTPVAQSRPRAVPSLVRARALERVATSQGQTSQPNHEPATASPAVPPGSLSAGRPSTDSRPGGPPAATAPSAQPAYGRGPWPRHLEGSPYRSRSTPPSASGSEANSTVPVGWPTSSPVGLVEQGSAGER